MAASASLAGSAIASGVTVHACGAAHDYANKSPAASRTENIYRNKNFSNAHTGAGQDQQLPGANRMIVQPSWLLTAINDAGGLGTGSDGRGGSTPTGIATPLTKAGRTEDVRQKKIDDKKSKAISQDAPEATGATNVDRFGAHGQLYFYAWPNDQDAAIAASCRTA